MAFAAKNKKGGGLAWLRAGLAVSQGALAAMQRAFPRAARREHPLDGTSRGPIPHGRQVPRPRTRASLKSVADKRHQFFTLQMATPAARLQHLVTEWAGERLRDLPLEYFDAIGPVANGLGSVESAQDWGNPLHAATCAAAAPIIKHSLAPMIPWRGEAPRLAWHGMVVARLARLTRLARLARLVWLWLG